LAGCLLCCSSSSSSIIWGLPKRSSCELVELLKSPKRRLIKNECHAAAAMMLPLLLFVFHHKEKNLIKSSFHSWFSSSSRMMTLEFHNKIELCH